MIAYWSLPLGYWRMGRARAAAEITVWFRIITKAGLPSEHAFSALSAECTERQPILGASIRTAQSRHAPAAPANNQ